MSAPDLGRRALLKGGLLGGAGAFTLAGAVASSGAASEGSAPETSSTGSADLVVPFHGEHQAGITTPPPPHAVFVGMDLADGVGGAQTLTLRRGASNEDVRRVLEAPGVREARLLRLSDAEGAFGGWVSQREEGHAFNRMEQYFLLGGDWCCSSRRANDGRLYPVDPPVLPVAAARRAYF